MKWWVEHRRPGKPSEFHIVHTPKSNEPDYYRQGISLHWFSARELSRRFPLDEDLKPLYNSISGMPIENCGVTRYEEAVKDNERFARIFGDGEPLPDAKEHRSLWDFYKAVGYDYKKQRYIKEQS